MRTSLARGPMLVLRDSEGKPVAGLVTTAFKGLRARARRPHTPGTMNGTEVRYAAHLELSKRAGLLCDWRFESVKLRLGGGAWFTPDFMVVTHEGFIEWHEVKGSFFREAAKVRIKVACEGFPWFRFLVVREKRKREGGGWSEEEVGA